VGDPEGPMQNTRVSTIGGGCRHALLFTRGSRQLATGIWVTRTKQFKTGPLAEGGSDPPALNIMRSRANIAVEQRAPDSTAL